MIVSGYQAVCLQFPDRDANQERSLLSPGQRPVRQDHSAGMMLILDYKTGSLHRYDVNSGLLDRNIAHINSGLLDRIIAQV